MLISQLAINLVSTPSMYLTSSPSIKMFTKLCNELFSSIIFAEIPEYMSFNLFIESKIVEFSSNSIFTDLHR